MTIPQPRLPVLAALLLFPAGCIPLTQTKVTGGRGYDNFDYYDDGRCGILQIGPSNRRRTASVIPAGSYASGPGGTRYGIAAEPHPYDRTTSDPYERERIYLLDADGHRRLKKWRNGSWEFHFEIMTPTGKQSRDFQAELWTFYYNPIIHGPPN